ncbi:RING-CH-type domain-containing protein [Heracleum sosnowskyi]|uniref:RING-CH-type domain-containing protein n=1 Tax=Heracleum sosnowskyi TaxID=360622 RepID=A0AAD8IL36_9APIA|nr:RING-CH-type domain-containing protein [Heracleum sosnowskyi]
MGDHFVLLVDRLLTESTLEAAVESRHLLKQLVAPENNDTIVHCTSHLESEIDLSPTKKVECRICQDEDLESLLEAPCLCRGSLKYAHRRCVQMWCRVKGNTTCEICNQQFRPNYTAPPPVFRLGSIPLNLRAIGRINLIDSHSIAMVPADRNFLDPIDDEYAGSAARSLMRYLSVAAIFMVLLMLRHTLPLIISGSDNYCLPLFLFFLLRTSGIILPAYIILRTVGAIRHRCY